MLNGYRLVEKHRMHIPPFVPITCPAEARGAAPGPLSRVYTRAICARRPATCCPATSCSFRQHIACISATLLFIYVTVHLYPEHICIPNNCANTIPQMLSPLHQNIVVHRCPRIIMIIQISRLPRCDGKMPLMRMLMVMLLMLLT